MLSGGKRPGVGSHIVARSGSDGELLDYFLLPVEGFQSSDKQY